MINIICGIGSTSSRIYRDSTRPTITTTKNIGDFLAIRNIDITVGNRTANVGATIDVAIHGAASNIHVSSRDSGICNAITVSTTKNMMLDCTTKNIHIS